MNIVIVAMRPMITMTLTLPLGSVDNVACLDDDDDDDEDNDVHAARSVWSCNLIPRLEHSLPRSYTCPPLTKNDDDEGGGDCDEHNEYNEHTIPRIILQY